MSSYVGLAVGGSIPALLARYGPTLEAYGSTSDFSGDEPVALETGPSSFNLRSIPFFVSSMSLTSSPSLNAMMPPLAAITGAPARNPARRAISVAAAA